MEKQKVIIGLSGGVDSAVAAYLLQQAGFEVIAVFLKFYSDTKDLLTGDCSYLEDLKDARKIASKLNISLIVEDREKEYKSFVLKPFYKAYEKGKTPNPDLACNSIMKFPILEKIAKKYDANYIATGHYARIKKIKDSYKLFAGLDSTKDQSYFLAELSENQLKNIIFPLGDMKKENVRNIAKSIGLPNWDKPSTRGICFVGKQNMPSFLKNKIKSKPGIIIDEFGNQLGTHPGSQLFTIGQKLGAHLGIIFNKPKKFSQSRWYVAKKQGNKILAVQENHPLLYKRKVQLTKFHKISKNEKLPSNIKVKICHLGDLISGKLSKNMKEFTFKKPVSSIAPGQYMVFYNKQQVIACAEMK